MNTEIIEPEKKSVPVALGVDPHTQAIVARDNSELMRIIRIMMKGSAFPKTLDTEEKVIAAWQVAASLKIPAAVAMQNMAVINGSVCVWGQIPKALAEATGELEDFQIHLLDKDHNVISMENKNLGTEVWAAVCRIKRRGRTLNEYTFTLDEADHAGLLSKNSPWKTYAKVMLSRRAIGHAIKFEFPDAVMGVGIAEYDHHQAPDLGEIKDVSPRYRGKAEELNAKMMEAEKKE